MIPVSRLFTVQKLMQDPSNALLSYTQKGIDFFEKMGQFSKERAAIEEDYSTKLKNLARKYAKKSEEEDEILKNVSYVNAFNLYLQQLDQIAAKHHSTAESLREDVNTYVSSKTCQLRSSRKNAIGDLKTINERLEEHINEMCKSGKAYVKSFKEAESAYQKFYKADKNLEISRLELEKARTHANTRTEACEKTKSEYSQSVTSANSEQKKYHEELLPVLFSRLKAVDKECIADMSQVLQKMLTVDEMQAESIANCRLTMQTIVDRIDPEGDAQQVLESVEATIEKPFPFELEDLGDPKDCESRANESIESKPRVEIAASSYHILKSPSKKRIIRNLLGMKEKENDAKKAESTKEPYTDKDKPPHVRLSCLRSKIRGMEKQLEQAVQGREGLTRLQKAYYENPQHGNPSACTGELIVYAKKIETLNTNIQNLKEFYTLLEMSVDGTPERSFGGRDTPDTTRSFSGGSANLSSSKTLDDNSGDPSSSCTSTLAATSSFGEETAKKMLRHFLNSPKRLISSPKSAKSPSVSGMSTPTRRKKDISSPVLRSSFSGAIRKMSAPSVEITSSPPTSSDAPIISAVAAFEFEKTTPETMSISVGDELITLEPDTGDGWTRAKKIKNQEVGFVPTAYLQFTADAPASASL
ncbi:unnamed protein product [Caenorhabditis sp. 36 PRJEB53466]|nr:unnamed protein product [Caenorhabditis sp. 36 PRJEB53466]